MFRDPTPGLEARRSDLLRRQRDDLAVLPHVVRRIYVARVARMAAAIAGIVGGLLLLLVSGIGPLPDLLAHVLPGKVPAPLSTLLLGSWIALAVVYFGARSAAEHRFAVAMSRCVLPGEDLQEDVQRLVREQPKLFALQMVRRLEVRATVAPVLAAGALGTATAMYLLLAISSLGYPKERVLDEALTHGTGSLAIGVAAAGLAGLAIACRWIQREHGRPLAVLSVIGWPVAFGLATLFYQEMVLLLAIGPLVVAGAAAWMLRRRGREAARMEEGRADESETFDLRRALASAQARVSRMRAALTVANARKAVGRVGRLALEHRAGLFMLSLGLGTVAAIYAASSSEPSPDLDMTHVTLVGAVEPTDKGAPASPEPSGRTLAASRPNGVLINVEVPEGERLATFDGFVADELPLVPRGWQARVTVSLVDLDGEAQARGEVPPAIVVTAAPGSPEVTPRLLNDYSRSAEFEIRNCGEGAPPPRLGLAVSRPKSVWPGRRHVVTLRYSAVMEMGVCPSWQSHP